MTNVQQLSDLPGLYELITKNGKSLPVNSKTAQSNTAVYGCNKAISDDLSGLPLCVYQKKDSKVRKATEHPAYNKIKLNPNPEMRAFNFSKAKLLHVLATGNAYTFIERSLSNPVKNLWPLDPDSITIERITLARGRGRIRYKCEDRYGRPKYYKQEDILHLKGYTWDGVVGQTPITNFAKTQVGIGLEMDVFQKAFFENGLNPGGIFQHPKFLGEKHKPGFMKALKKRFGGSKKSGGPMILENGMEFKPYEIKMADQQFIDLLKLNKTDICGILGVPESRVSISGSNTNYNNTEAERRRYMESGLLPWAIPDEQEMSFRLLTETDRKAGYYIKYNFSGFLRGDSKERAEVSKIWSNMGVPVNKLLELEDQNPVDGGDVGFIQINMAPIKELGKPGFNDEPVQQNSSNKQIENRTIEERTVTQIFNGRDRITKRYLPIINEAVEKIVNRENIAVTKEIKKQNTNRSDADFSKWVDGFYKTFPDFIDKNLRSILLSYSESMQDIVAGEIDIDEFDDITDDTLEYLSGYSAQYVSSARGQIFQQLEKGDLDTVQERVDEWREKKTDKEVSELSVGVAGMVARATIIGGGFALVWRARGKSCPMCNQLNGRTVTKKDQAFTDRDEDFTDANENTVTFRQTLYAPLHKGCDCAVMAK